MTNVAGAQVGVEQVELILGELEAGSSADVGCVDDDEWSLALLEKVSVCFFLEDTLVESLGQDICARIERR